MPSRCGWGCFRKGEWWCGACLPCAVGIRERAVEQEWGRGRGRTGILERHEGIELRRGGSCEAIAYGLCRAVLDLCRNEDNSGPWHGVAHSSSYRIRSEKGHPIKRLRTCCFTTACTPGLSCAHPRTRELPLFTLPAVTTNLRLSAASLHQFGSRRRREAP